MTTREAFTAEEWDLLMRAPAAAVLAVEEADRKGRRRENRAIASAWVEAALAHPRAAALIPEATMIEALVRDPPADGRGAAASRQAAVDACGAVAEVLRRRAAPDELDAYAGFVVQLADGVAQAGGGVLHRGVASSEREVVEALAGALAG